MEGYWLTVIKMENKKQKVIEEEIELPEGVKGSVDTNVLLFEGPKGNTSRKLQIPGIDIIIEGKKVLIKAKKAGKKEKKSIGTFKAHIKNMIKGVTEGHVYHLKICSGHFPMNVSVSNKEFVVKNFLGEKTPRKIKLSDGADVKIEGTLITVEGCNKEITSQTAANIERLTKIKNKDLRIFQDGIYIINKDGKEIK